MPSHQSCLGIYLHAFEGGWRQEGVFTSRWPPHTVRDADGYFKTIISAQTSWTSPSEAADSRPGTDGSARCAAGGLVEKLAGDPARLLPALRGPTGLPLAVADACGASAWSRSVTAHPNRLQVLPVLQQEAE